MKLDDIMMKIFIILIWLLIGAFAALYIYALIAYGNTPAIDAPVWVRWLLGGLIYALLV